MTTVEIVAVSNELLTGDVLDTNTNWLCKEVTGLGGQVRRTYSGATTALPVSQQW